jgi:glucan biosynthesis protein C
MMAFCTPPSEISQAVNGESSRTSSSGQKGEEVPSNINTVRGLACLLIVALHVVGDAASNGLHLPMTSAWHYVMQSIEFLRIPLFTALSGYLYAGRRVTAQKLSNFWTKKVAPAGCSTCIRDAGHVVAPGPRRG